MSCSTPQSARIWLACNKGITQFYLPPTHKPYLPLLPRRKASPPFGRYQLVLLGEQRHIGVRNMPGLFTPRARPRLEPWPLDHKSDTLPTAPRRHTCSYWSSGWRSVLLISALTAMSADRLKFHVMQTAVLWWSTLVVASRLATVGILFHWNY